MVEVEVEKGGSENGLMQRGCASVVNGKMMYFGGLYDPMQVCVYIIFYMIRTQDGIKVTSKHSLSMRTLANYALKSLILFCLGAILSYVYEPFSDKYDRKLQNDQTRRFAF